MERTLSIIKPDGVKRGLIGEIVKRLEQNRLNIIAMKMIHMTKDQAKGFYAIHQQRPFFENLTDLRQIFRDFDTVVLLKFHRLLDQLLDLLEELGLHEPGLHRVIRAAYRLLGLHTYFTAGPKEVRAWTVKIGATAPQAAGVIHTDFEKGFIRAEVTAYDDFVACNGEHGAKEAGKLRLEGKDYVVQDGDVIHFRFNV